MAEQSPSVEPQAVNPETATRKRSYAHVPFTADADVKRSKVAERHVPGNVLSLCEEESEEGEGEREGEGEVMEGSYGSETSSADRSDVPVAGSSTHSGGRSSRNMTPPIPVDEVEMQRKV